MKKVTKIAEAANTKVKLKKIRVAAYCRVSTDSDAQLESLEAQKTHYETYITSRDDWEFAGLYYDEGITGTKKDKRPELMRLIGDCKAGRIDFIVTKSISRFSRNTTDCLELVRNLLDLNIPIFFEKENINTGSMESELFLAILSGMAESESVSISENSKWSIQKRFENGTFKCSYPPYGYDWDGEQMVINPEQAAVVKEIFAALLSGKGTHAIADDLNRRGVSSKRGGRWTATTIRGMLSNEKYVGDCLFQKTYSDSQFVRHNNHGEQTQYMVTDHHEPIISREDFEAARIFISQRASEKGVTKGTDKYQNRYAFSGKIICGECGDAPITNTSRGAATPISKTRIGATCFIRQIFSVEKQCICRNRCGSVLCLFLTLNMDRLERYAVFFCRLLYNRNILCIERTLAGIVQNIT